MSDTLSLPPAGADKKTGLHSALPLWLRLPKPLGRCQFTGMSRGTMIELILPCAANGNRAPVKSVQIKKKYATRGIRLISGPSLAEYLDGLATQQACEAACDATGAGNAEEAD